MSKPTMYTKFAKPWIGNSILISSGSLWKKLRKLDVVCFTHRNMENSMYSINNFCKDFNKTLEENLYYDSFDLNKITEKNMLALFASLVLEYSNLEKDVMDDLYWCTSAIVAIVVKRFWCVHYQIDWMYKLSSLYQLQEKTVKKFNEIINKALQKRKKILAEENYDEKTFALVDNLIRVAKTDKNITDDLICGEIATFMLAGVDTISVIVKFTLFELSKHKVIQDRVAEELIEVFKDDFTRDIAMRDVQSMKYLNMVIKETMRMYTATPLIGRVLSEDIEHGMKIIIITFYQYFILLIFIKFYTICSLNINFFSKLTFIFNGNTLQIFYFL